MVSADGLRKKRRYAIVLAFVAAAILTPPDVISQIGLAIPTILLYELSIYCVAMVQTIQVEDEEEVSNNDESDGKDSGEKPND